MISAAVLITLILVVGAIIMMLIAAKTGRGLEVSRTKFIFLPPDTSKEAIGKRAEEFPKPSGGRFSKQAVAKVAARHPRSPPQAPPESG